MPQGSIPDDIRRFVLTSIDSVPHLEAMLLMRNEPEHTWDAVQIAARLYMPDERAATLLRQLRAAGIAREVSQQPLSCRYDPSTPELRELIERLADVYAHHLVEIAKMIHSQEDTQARRFADAFRFRKDS